jgi:hypothetical protein
MTLLAVSAIFSGCRTNSSTPSGTSNGRARAETVRATPEVNIYVDEAVLRKPYAVLGGTVENAGSKPLANLSIEMELKRRGSDVRETRDVAVVPANLAPGEKGKYLLKVKSEEWGDFRIARLKSLDGPTEIAFKPLPGAPRPPERVNGSRTLPADAPRRPSQGSDDFINTPDTPIAVP